MIFEILGVEVGSKNRSKNEVNMGRHLGIDFSSILVDFGRQLGKEKRAKIDQEWHRKNDGKKKGSKIAKKAQKVRATRCGTTGPRSRGGPPLSGGTILWGQRDGPLGL